jgi:hypothetical protein
MYAERCPSCVAKILCKARRETSAPVGWRNGRQAAEGRQRAFHDCITFEKPAEKFRPGCEHLT